MVKPVDVVLKSSDTAVVRFVVCVLCVLCVPLGMLSVVLFVPV